MHRYAIFTLTLLILLSFNSAAQNIEFKKSNFPGRKKEFKEALKNFNTGSMYFELGKAKYHTALEYLLKAHKVNPNNAELNYLIGVCYLNTIKQSKSIEFFEKSISLESDLFRTVKYQLAQAYQINYEFDKAINLYIEFKQSLQSDELAFEFPDIDKKLQECKNGKDLVKNPVRYKIDNLGPVVNTIYQEYSPLINPDETELFFTARKNNTTGGKIDYRNFDYYEDIYITNKTSSGWSTPKNPTKPLNSKRHDATVGLAHDNRTLLVYKGSNGGDIYQCDPNRDNWSKPKKLNKNINTKYHESAGSITSDGKTLYFVSNRPGGFGGRDIYTSAKEKNGNWGPAQNLGSVINTKYDEEGIFLQSDGKALYFSSKGHNSMGGYDIFKSTFENSKWSEPLNIGYPINTTDDDVFFSISANGVHGYYSSEKAEGYGGQDIYIITLIELEKPLVNNTEDSLLASIIHKDTTNRKVTILKGIVMDDNTLAPVASVIEFTDIDSNKVITNCESNISTGKFLVSVPSDRNYGITVKSNGYSTHFENQIIPYSSIDIEKNIMLFRLTKPSDITKLEIDNSFILSNILFDFNKSTLRQEAIPKVERLLKFVKDNPSVKIEISGHTDNIGPVAYNRTLSENRAKTVVNYLITKGVNQERLTYLGYGFDKPVAPNNTIEGRQLNRRTEFKIINGEISQVSVTRPQIDSAFEWTIIYFDFDKSSIRQESVPKVEKLLKFMIDNPNSKIEVSGHTDNKGTAAYNKPLSERRANIVVNYLVNKGITANRITSLGYGFDNPIATNETVEGRQLNRRAQFRIISK